MYQWITKLAVLVVVLLISGVFQTSSHVAAQSPTTATDVTFPDLTGPYKVGRVAYEWVDQSRDETCADIPGLKRDLMVYVWFPASPAKRAKAASYMDTDLAFNIWFGQLNGQPGQMAKIHAHAFNTTNLDTDKTTYPVLIFIPGYYDQSQNYASIIEELVSHGYIVIGTTHPYGSGVVAYPDGRLVTRPSTAKCIPDDISGATWLQDVQFVLNQAEKLNTTDETFKGHLDLTRIGIIGHSFGGDTAIHEAANDPRIKAGVSLDSNAKTGKLGSPFLFIGSFAVPNQEQETVGTYWLKIDGTDHLNYGDFGLLKPLYPQMELLGSIDPARCIQIVNRYLLGFFDHYLNGADLNWPSFDEAHLQIFK